jgi:D-serine dehydratase
MIADEQRQFAEELARADQLVGQAITELELHLSFLDDEHLATELAALEDHATLRYIPHRTAGAEQGELLVGQFAGQQQRPWAVAGQLG